MVTPPASMLAGGVCVLDVGDVFAGKPASCQQNKQRADAHVNCVGAERGR